MLDRKIKCRNPQEKLSVETTISKLSMFFESGYKIILLDRNLERSNTILRRLITHNEFIVDNFVECINEFLTRIQCRSWLNDKQPIFDVLFWYDADDKVQYSLDSVTTDIILDEFRRLPIYLDESPPTNEDMEKVKRSLERINKCGSKGKNINDVHSNINTCLTNMKSSDLEGIDKLICSAELYEQDDGVLTDEQISKIREHSPDFNSLTLKSSLFEQYLRNDTIIKPPNAAELCNGEIGRKFDQGKVQFSLIPPAAIKEVAKVLTFGARKYAPDNWRKVSDAKNRYLNATLRHINDVQCGELFDSESSIHHYAHAICDLLFLLEFELDRINNVTKE